MALILAQFRRIPAARDNQSARHWPGMIGDLSQREDERGGKTLLVIGLGRIGGRLARLAQAFDMTVTGFRRDLRAAFLQTNPKARRLWSLEQDFAAF